MDRFILPGFSILILLILLGCAQSNNQTTPVLPPDDPIDSVTESHAGFASTGTVSKDIGLSEGLSLPISGSPIISDDHNLLGIWRIRLWDDGTYEIIPRRTEQIHIAVTDMIMTCPDCFTIFMGPPPGPNMFDFNITLKNPSIYTGYDVTGIIRSSGDITFINPDSYTLLYSEPGDTTPNPYVAYDTGVGNHEFPPGNFFTEMLRFEKGGITKFGEMDYVIQASWPTNQEEPYAIWGLLASADFHNDGSNMVDLRCRVGDWQGNVDSVTVDLTPVGGASGTPMSFLVDNIWELTDVAYSPYGQGLGEHRLLVTATSNGVSTYNYLPVTVVEITPATQGPFLIQYQNLPLEDSSGPTDGMDIAVMGADDGDHVAMVFGGDDTYHFWSSDYKDGSFGLYYEGSGEPVKPFDMPNFHFDFADADLSEITVDSIFSLAWGESNTSSEILDSDTVPPVIARQRISLWNLNDGNLKITANVLIIGMDPGPPVTYGAIVRPIEFASGFRKNGLLYMTLVFDSGDPAEFPVVDIMALKPPHDFAGNPIPGAIAYEIGIDDGSGAGVVNRDAIVGVDIDDSLLMEITGGYAGHAWIAVAEAGVENTLEIIDADIDTHSNVFISIPLSSPPVDVEILPLTDVGEASNAICVLCEDNVIRLYDYAGILLYTIGGPPYMIGSALRIDIDDKNLAIHVLHQGTTSPLVTVYKWIG